MIRLLMAAAMSLAISLIGAKLLLELDRAQWLREQGAKSVHITRIEPADAMRYE